jgi:membrane-associated protease RseP (regulator of RpoE activity)
MSPLNFFVGQTAKLFLGDALKDGTPISINPLVLWAWSGLLINAINSIPAGELDGGRIGFALWGRKVSCLIFLTVILDMFDVYTNTKQKLTLIVFGTFLSRSSITRPPTKLS